MLPPLEQQNLLGQACVDLGKHGLRELVGFKQTTKQQGRGGIR